MEFPRIPIWFGYVMIAFTAIGIIAAVAGIIAGVWWLVEHVRFV